MARLSIHLQCIFGIVCYVTTRANKTVGGDVKCYKSKCSGIEQNSKSEVDTKQEIFRDKGIDIKSYSTSATSRLVFHNLEKPSPSIDRWKCSPIYEFDTGNTGDFHDGWTVVLKLHAESGRPCSCGLNMLV